MSPPRTVASLGATGLLALSLLGVVAPRAAHASPPCACPNDPPVPTPGATGVPTNARLFLTTGDGVPPALTLTPAGGPAVLLDAEGTGGTLGEVWLVPSENLLPNTEYTATFLDGGASWTFTTGSGPDTVAPTLGSVAASTAPLSGACESHVSTTLLASDLSDDAIADDELLLRVHIDAAGGARTVWLRGPDGSLGYFSSPAWSACLANFTDADPGEPLRATITAFDWSGNASAPVELESFSLTSHANCGCSVPGASPRGRAWAPGALGALSFALAARARRPRSTAVRGVRSKRN
jgi:hypothetical protein